LRHVRALATLLVMTALLVAPAAWAQKNFRTPDDAFKALVAAARAHDSKALESILGPGGKKILPSGDPVADRNALDRFAKAYDEANKIETAGEEKATLTVGNDAWPFPIPVIKTAGGWHFDPKQGQEELLNRPHRPQRTYRDSGRAGVCRCAARVLHAQSRERQATALRAEIREYER
jgi:hypothetical protein